MAIHLHSSKTTIAVVSRKDDALPSDLTPEEWEKYVDTLEESHLRLVEGKSPTRFLMRLHLPYAAQQAIQSQQVTANEEGKVEVRLGFILEVVRCALVGIENPADLPVEQHVIFTKDRDGNANKELIALLHEAGIVMDLYSTREATISKKSQAPIKK